MNTVSDLIERRLRNRDADLELDQWGEIEDQNVKKVTQRNRSIEFNHNVENSNRFQNIDRQVESGIAMMVSYLRVVAFASIVLACLALFSEQLIPAETSRYSDVRYGMQVATMSLFATSLFLSLAFMLALAAQQARSDDPGKVAAALFGYAFFATVIPFLCGILCLTGSIVAYLL